MLLHIIAGATPNFMKISPLIEAIEIVKKQGEEIDCPLIHTGQHYDKQMSGDFFEQFGIAEPYANLEAGGGTLEEALQNLRDGKTAQRIVKELFTIYLL